MSPSFHRSRIAIALALAPLLTGCRQDPTCVFTTGCRGDSTGGGPAGTQPAAFPPPGAWISNLPPVIEDVFPKGASVGADTPIAILFNESMNEASLAGAFELVPFDGLNFLAPVTIANEVLVGDGRLFLLFPESSLPANGYRVRVSTAGLSGGSAPVATDVTGQELDLLPGALLGSVFTVPFNQPTDPAIVTTFPAEGDTAAGAGGEIVVVFDRALDPASVTASSFNVLVAGADPANDPLATAVDVAGTADTRVYSWRSTDAFGNRFDLTAGANVDVLLSATGSKLTDLDGDPLPDTTVSFTIAPFSAPTALSLLSQPSDAIGLANLTLDGTEDLALQVDLLDAVDGDTLELFLFGVDAIGTSADLIALRRDFPLSGSSPILVRQLDATEVDLTVGGDPTQPRFLDGPIRIGARIRHLNSVSPLRLLDADPALTGAQDAVLDTVPPTVLTLDGSGASLTSPVSDVGDLVLIGQADEPLRALDVTATSGATTLDNGSLAPMPASAADGTFLAAPVPLGVLEDGTATYSAVAYDVALNASAPFTGTFRQRGGVGPGAFVPGDAVTVEVFDAQTLAPLAGANVALHADLGDGVNYPLTVSGTTASDGTFVGTSDAAASEVIVTAERAGYDIVSVHGLTSSRVSLGLRPSGTGAGASVMGSVESDDVLALFLLPSLSGRLDDTRRSPIPARTFATGACTFGTQVACPFGPEPVEIARRGARSYFAGDFGPTEAAYDPVNVLQVFCLELALPPLSLGGVEDTTIELPFLLIDPTVDPTELPEDLAAFSLRTDTVSGLDLANLDDDPDTTGEPRVTVETTVPGLAGALAIGPGLAFDQGGGLSTVRSVRPGAAAAAGFFGGRGAVDTDAFVRCELRDLAGNVAAARPRLSSLASLPGGVAVPPDVPVPVFPVQGGSSAGRAFDVRFPDTMGDVAGWAGVYRVELTDGAGRAWTLWRRDPSGTGEVRARIVDLSPLGTSGLADGSIALQVSSHAWPGMDPARFLFSDVERKQEATARSAPLQFTLP